MSKLIESIKSASIAKSFGNGAIKFFRDEEGAQIVEYALIIAVVSIALVIALYALAGPTSPFTDFIARVNTCLTSTTAGSCK
jgi:pilus assembly protein Flp/PilA